MVYVMCLEEKRPAYRTLIVLSEGKRLLGRPRHRLMDNIEVVLGEFRFGNVDWIYLAQDRDRW
jgi:hypothetical protein